MLVDKPLFDVHNRGGPVRKLPCLTADLEMRLLPSAKGTPNSVGFGDVRCDMPSDARTRMRACNIRRRSACVSRASQPLLLRRRSCPFRSRRSVRRGSTLPRSSRSTRLGQCPRACPQLVPLPPPPRVAPRPHRSPCTVQVRLKPAPRPRARASLSSSITTTCAPVGNLQAKHGASIMTQRAHVHSTQQLLMQSCSRLTARWCTRRNRARSAPG